MNLLVTKGGRRGHKQSWDFMEIFLVWYLVQSEENIRQSRKSDIFHSRLTNSQFSRNNCATIRTASNGILLSPSSSLSLMVSPLLFSVRAPCRLQAIEQAVLARLVLFLAVKLGQLRLSQEEHRDAPILTPEETSSCSLGMKWWAYTLWKL